MSVMRCPNCGGEYEFSYEKGYRCRSCGKRGEVNGLFENDVEMLNLANEKRIEQYDFDGALALCHKVLSRSPQNQEANWCALLAAFKVVYLKNNEGKYVPTFIEPNMPHSLTDSPYYANLNLLHKRDVDEIENCRLRVLEDFNAFPNYDVFICYKRTKGIKGSETTPESDWADEIYNALTRENLRVFIDKKSLHGNAGWEPHIYSALRSAKFMIVLSSSLENLNSPWVKNEWKRFIAFSKVDRTKKLAVACPKSSVPPEKLPDEAMRRVSMINIEERGWKQELKERAIDAVGSKLIDTTILLEEATAAIRRKKFSKAKSVYEEIKKRNPRNARAHWGLLMCRYRAFDNYDIVKSRKHVENFREFRDAIDCANPYESAEFESVIRAQKNDNDTTGFSRTNYEIYMNKTKTLRRFKKFVMIFLASIFAVGAAVGGIFYGHKKANEYTLHLDYGEAAGTVESAKSYYGKAIPELPKELSVQDKYWLDFTGWFTERDGKGIKVADADGKSLLDFSDELVSLCDGKHNLTLYASFEIHKYEVKFYDDDGKTVLKTEKYEYGTSVEDFGSDVSAGDRKVLTWSEEKGGEEFDGFITKDVSLYATSFAVTVTYESDGGSEIESETVRVGDRVPLPATEKEYFGFLGWSYENKIVEYGFIAPDKNITLTAKWKRTHFTITYDSNGGNAVQSEIVKTDITPTLPVPEREYHEFKGWSYNGNLVADGFAMPEKNITLVAVWKQSHYELRFDTDGAGEIDSKMAEIGKEITLPTPTKEYYEFKGWTLGGEVVNSYFVMPEKNIMLVAVWKRSHYELRFDTDGAGEIDSKMAEIGKEITLPTPTKRYYEFKGWTLGGELVNSSFVMPEKNVTLVAVWKRSHYELRFDTSGAGTMSSKMVKTGETVTLASPKKNYYDFTGWTYGGKTVNNSFVMPENNVTLVANWTKTYKDYTYVSAASEFLAIKNNPSGKYLLTNDIDLSGSVFSTINSFGGELKGDGHTVNLGNRVYTVNIHIDTGGHTYAGWFAVTNTGKISDITVKNLKFKSESYYHGSSTRVYMGGLVGFNMPTGTIENVKVVNEKTGTTNGMNAEIVCERNNSALGGIAGVNQGNITGCSVFALIYGNGDTGGIVGENSGSIKNCVYDGRIGIYLSNNNNDIWVRAWGGIVGYTSGSVSGCRAENVSFEYWGEESRYHRTFHSRCDLYVKVGMIAGSAKSRDLLSGCDMSGCNMNLVLKGGNFHNGSHEKQNLFAVDGGMIGKIE